MLHTKSSTHYIKDMENGCVQMPDTRAARALAMELNTSIMIFIKAYCHTYKAVLPNVARNPQDHWSYVCAYLDTNYKVEDGIRDLWKQLMALRPYWEISTNNALQTFQSQFLTLKAQIAVLTDLGAYSRDPYKEAEEENHLDRTIPETAQAVHC